MNKFWKKRYDMENKITTGNALLDKMLEGGIETDVITTIYGPAGSGKTLFCLMAMVAVEKFNKKVIFVDTEGGFSAARLKQLNEKYEDVLKNTIFLHPTSFDEQKKVIEKLKEHINDKIGLIIVDSISMLYRLQRTNEEAVEVNRELGAQIAALTEIARKKNIPVLITNQVYASFEDKNKINIVGGDILKYGSKCLVELQVTPNNKRRAILRKHRSLPEKEFEFEIVPEGIIEAKSGSFRLF